MVFYVVMTCGALLVWALRGSKARISGGASTNEPPQPVPELPALRHPAAIPDTVPSAWVHFYRTQDGDTAPPG